MIHYLQHLFKSLDLPSGEGVLISTSTGSVVFKVAQVVDALFSLGRLLLIVPRAYAVERRRTRRQSQVRDYFLGNVVFELLQGTI